MKCDDSYVINAPEELTTLLKKEEDSCLKYVCGEGYFSDSLQCQPCPHGCKECLINGNCHTCMSGFKFEYSSRMCIPSECSMVNQYADSNASPVCVNCDPSCRSCFGGSQNCTSCNRNVTSQTYFFNGSCESGCPAGYFGHLLSGQCRRCDPRC